MKKASHILVPTGADKEFLFFIVFVLAFAFLLSNQSLAGISYLVQHTQTQLYDDFDNTTIGGDVQNITYGLTSWSKDGVGCVYNGTGFMNCSHTSATGILGEIYPPQGSVTAQTRCSTGDVTGTNLCDLLLNAKSGGERCRVSIKEGNFTYTENGAEKILPNYTFVNDTFYIFSVTHKPAELVCDYFVMNDNNHADNFSFLSANESQLTNNITNYVYSAELRAGANGKSIFDYIYVFNGTRFDDPAIRLVNFTFFSPAFMQHFINFSEDILLSGNVTGNNNVTLLNVTYNFPENRTDIAVCTNCANWTINITNANFHGRVSLNISFQAGTIFEETILPVFKGAVVENCSINNPPFYPALNQSYNFSFKDENSEALLTGVAADVQVVAWNTTVEDNVTFSSQYGSIGDFGLCIHPNETIRANYYIDTTRTSYEARRYQRQVQPFSTTLQNIDVFLIQTADATAITFTIVDGRQQPLQGLLLEAYRVRIDNTQDFVESFVSDIAGEVQLQLDQTKEYSFIIRRLDGTVLQTIDKFKPIDTTYTLEVDLDPKVILKTLQDIHDVSRNLTYNNVTRTISATWSATPDLITLGCLELANRTLLNTQGVINTTCVSGDSGTVLFNATSLNNTLIYASLYVTSARDNQNYTLETLTIDLIEDTFLRWGFMGLFVAVFVIFTVMGGIALNSPFLVVLSMMAGVFLLFFTGMTALSWGAAISIISVGGLILYFIRSG